MRNDDNHRVGRSSAPDHGELFRARQFQEANPWHVERVNTTLPINFSKRVLKGNVTIKIERGKKRIKSGPTVDIFRNIQVPGGDTHQ
jgi:hypothetical protein